MRGETWLERGQGLDVSRATWEAAAAAGPLRSERPKSNGQGWAGCLKHQRIQQEENEGEPRARQEDGVRPRCLAVILIITPLYN